MDERSSESAGTRDTAPEHGLWPAPRVRFIVAGLPVPQGSLRPVPGRGRLAGRTMLVPDNEAELHRWRRHVAQSCSMVYSRPATSTAWSVRLVFTLPRPLSVSSRRRPLPTVRPDLDKLVRAVLDALTGVLFADDAQVVALIATKAYGAVPQLAVEAYEGTSATRGPECETGR